MFCRPRGICCLGSDCLVTSCWPLKAMEKVVVVRAFLLARKREAMRRVKWRSRQTMKRRTAFTQRQAQERLIFTFLLAIVSATLQGSAVRSLWCKERSSHWWQHIVHRSFTANDWNENFRMSHATFLYVCNQLRPFIEKSDTQMRKCIPPERRVAVTLWFLATNADYRTIGHLFGISKASVCLVIKEVCAAIVNVLQPRYIKWPTGESLKTVIQAFQEKNGFPQCAGAVDGTHIPIVSPKHCPADYYNRKGWHSVIMQGVVDHLGHFTDIYVGWPG